MNFLPSSISSIFHPYRKNMPTNRVNNKRLYPRRKQLSFDEQSDLYEKTLHQIFINRELIVKRRFRYKLQLKIHMYKDGLTALVYK